MSDPQVPHDGDIKLGRFVSPQLLKGLEQVFPLRPPALNTPDRRIWFDAGIQSVIAYLKDQHEESMAQALDRVLSE